VLDVLVGLACFLGNVTVTILLLLLLLPLFPWLQAPGTFDRVISIEMFEHMKNYQELLRRISTWLKPGGLLFVHIFCHKTCPYHFEASSGLLPHLCTALTVSQQVPCSAGAGRRLMLCAAIQDGVELLMHSRECNMSNWATGDMSNWATGDMSNWATGDMSNWATGDMSNWATGDAPVACWNRGCSMCPSIHT
jgi:hypothetical protein